MSGAFNVRQQSLQLRRPCSAWRECSRWDGRGSGARLRKHGGGDRPLNNGWARQRQSRSARTRFTRVWVRQQGRWRLVANLFWVRVAQ